MGADKTAPEVKPKAKAEPARAHEPRSNDPIAGILSALGAQAKLMVGAADDAYEREADAVARDVLQAIRRRHDSIAAGHRDEPPSSPRIQRRPVVGETGGPVDTGTERAIESARGGGHRLEPMVRNDMEAAFGADFGAVRIHSGSMASELNDRVQAKAFTLGSDIFFRDGAPPSSPAGTELLAHELTHTVQQGGAPSLRRAVAHGRERVQRKPADTYATTTTGALSTELSTGLTLAKANPDPGGLTEPPWNRPTDNQPYNSKQRKQFASKWAWEFKNVKGKLPGVAGAGGYHEYYAPPAAGADKVWGSNRIMRQVNDTDGTYWWATADHYETFEWITDA